MDGNKLAVDSVLLSQSSDHYQDRRQRALEERVSHAAQYLVRAGVLTVDHRSTQRYDVGVDSQTHEMVVRVLDRASGEVLYQIPTKTVLRMAAEARQASKSGTP